MAIRHLLHLLSIKGWLSKEEIDKMVQAAAVEYQNKPGCNNVLEGYVYI
jgi:hypothetical protein